MSVVLRACHVRWRGMGAWLYAVGFSHGIDSRGGLQGYLLLVLFVLWFHISLASKGSVYGWC